MAQQRYAGGLNEQACGDGDRTAADHVTRRSARWALCALVALAAPAHAVIIGIQTDGSVYSIDEGTGASTLLSDNPSFAANSMAKNSAGTFYTAGGLGNSLLNTINPATGVLTAGVFISGNDNVRGLAFSPGDVLYATSATGGGAGASLYTIDVASGVTTLIAAVGTMQGLEFSPSGILYGWSATLGLVTIDPASGAVTDVNASVGSTAPIQTIAFSTTGAAYAGSQTDLYTVDLATGVLTLVGSVAPVTDLRGMQFDAAPPLAPGVSLAPAALVFGPQTVGTTSGVQPLMLQNTGGAALNIASITATGDFAQSNNCGATLAALSSCTIDVSFTPTAPGARVGAVSVASNAAGSPQSAALDGTGIGPPLVPPDAAPVPTVSQWGLLLLALFMIAVAFADRRFRMRGE